MKFMLVSVFPDYGCSNSTCNLPPKLESFRKELGLGQDSVVLCLSTEGDTDKENYRHIVWDGWYRNENTERNV
ncbi:hypothetical protein E0L13_08465 [Megasphaera sp. SW808]|nr:hypothetical protein [Megasphaera sp. SW808]